MGVRVGVRTPVRRKPSGPVALTHTPVHVRTVSVLHVCVNINLIHVNAAAAATKHYCDKGQASDLSHIVATRTPQVGCSTWFNTTQCKTIPPAY